MRRAEKEASNPAIPKPEKPLCGKNPGLGRKTRSRPARYVPVPARKIQTHPAANPRLMPAADNAGEAPPAKAQCGGVLGPPMRGVLPDRRPVLLRPILGIGNP